MLIGIIPQITSGISAILIATFIFHNSWLISQGFGYEPCGCLGVLDRVLGGKLSTTGALYIDIGLFILALAVYFFYPGKLLNIRPWLVKRGKTDNGSSAEGMENIGNGDSTAAED